MDRYKNKEWKKGLQKAYMYCQLSFENGFHTCVCMDYGVYIYIWNDFHVCELTVSTSTMYNIL